jgi:hypothetical protein
VLPGCGDEPRPPPFIGNAGGTGGLLGTGGVDPVDDCERPPEPDEETLCGNELVPVLQQKPNLYFVLDVSASMATAMDGGTTQRLTVAKNAVTQLLHEVGHRVNYGLAVFPADGADPSGDGSCSAGDELFATQEGDPVQCVNQRRTGPVLLSLIRQLNRVSPSGGTPLGATLDALTPQIAALPGTTAVVLITDGAPNCSLTPCEADQCMLNVEGFQYLGQTCDEDLNCCDPEVIESELAPLNCVDRPGTVGAVAALAAQGIKTYVVGIPGTEFYVDLLDELAEAGGTAQAGARKYFAISDGAALQDALSQIGNDVAISCDLALGSDSFEPDLTNVYFDSALVPASADDGWTLDGRTIHIHGTYCDDLLAGRVANVQIVSGCPTVVR